MGTCRSPQNACQKRRRLELDRTGDYNIIFCSFCILRSSCPFSAFGALNPARTRTSLRTLRRPSVTGQALSLVMKFLAHQMHPAWTALPRFQHPARPPPGAPAPSAPPPHPSTLSVPHPPPSPQRAHRRGAPCGRSRARSALRRRSRRAGGGRRRGLGRGWSGRGWSGKLRVAERGA